MIENMLDSLMHTLENASGRSMGMVMGVMGIVVWWVVSRVQKAMRVLSDEDVRLDAETVVERPRRRLSLRAYHR